MVLPHVMWLVVVVLVLTNVQCIHTLTGPHMGTIGTHVHHVWYDT